MRTRTGPCAEPSPLRRRPNAEELIGRDFTGHRDRPGVLGSRHRKRLPRGLCDAAGTSRAPSEVVALASHCFLDVDSRSLRGNARRRPGCPGRTQTLAPQCSSVRAKGPRQRGVCLLTGPGSGPGAGGPVLSRAQEGSSAGDQTLGPARSFQWVIVALVVEAQGHMPGPTLHPGGPPALGAAALVLGSRALQTAGPHSV